MKDFAKDLARWWDDPVTQSLFAALGVLVIMGGIKEAHRRAGRLELRADSLERRVRKLES